MLHPPLLQFILPNLPQLINLRRLPRYGPLHHLHPPTHRIPPCNGIGNRLGLHLNHPDTWIIWPTIMFPVAEVAYPGLEQGAVVLFDSCAVGEDGGAAGDGGPFAGRVEEGDVD